MASRFADRATRPARGFRHLVRWQIERLTRSTDIQGAVPGAALRAADATVLDGSRPNLTWVGHATFVLRLSGSVVVTDPIWRTWLGVRRRLVPPGLPLAEVSRRADVVLISHNHYDHMDGWTLRRFGPQPTYVVPLGNGGVLRRLGACDVVELDWWQTHRHRNLEITLVPARHWSMRTPWNRNATLWGGFVVRSPDGSFYHSGDTAFFEDFAEIGRRVGPIDWALLPIGAYEPRWFMQPQHMCPEEAGQAFELLGARHLVAMHWGTFELTDEPVGAPPVRLRQWAAEHGYGDDRIWVLDIGETRWLDGPLPR